MWKLPIVIAFSLLLAACSPVTLNRDNFKTSKIDAVTLSNPNETITHFVSDSSTTGAAAGGLIGALIAGSIDGGVNSKRANNLSPVIEALGDFKPYSYLSAALINESRGESFLHPIIVSNSGSKNSEFNPIVTPRYIMSPDFSSITTELSISLKQQNNGGKPYISTYYGVETREGESESITNRQFWIDNPNELVNSINASITQSVQKLVSDINGVAYLAQPRAEGVYPSFEIAAKNMASDIPLETNSDLKTFSNEEINHSEHPEIVKNLRSSNTIFIRDAAKQVGAEMLYNDSSIILASIAALRRGLEINVGKKDKYLIDGLSWCALNLGNAKDQRAKPILVEIIASSLPKKLRNHAIHALNVINEG